MSTFRQKAKQRANNPKAGVFNVDELVKLIQTNDLGTALSKLLESMGHKERVSVAAEIFTKSKYRSYKMAIERFKSVVEDFMKDNKNSVLAYCEEIEMETKDRGFSYGNADFSSTRKMLVLDMIDSMPSTTYMALANIVALECVQTQDVNRTMLSVISKVASKKWPENNALMVLFG